MDQRSRRKPSLTYLQARGIARTYNALLEKKGRAIVDERSLPFSKAVIKQALLLAIRLAPSEEVRRGLARSYLMLSEFQSEVGNEPIRGPRAFGRAPKSQGEVVAMAASLEKSLPWLRKSTIEMRQLTKELQDNGIKD